MVIDSTDRERLQIAKQELYRMLANEELCKAAIVIYANKQDVDGSMSAAEISNELNLTSVKTHRYHIQSCCALTGQGWVTGDQINYKRRLQQGLEWMASNIKR